MSIQYLWRGDIDNNEINALHAEAFETRLFTADEWDWRLLLTRHSLGWVVARDENRLVGFVNVIWDGCAHAWIQDTMVASDSRGRGIGKYLVEAATGEARKAGCEWLHVDFEDHLATFYYDACGFTPTSAGLIHLKPAGE
jgi:GNAT superfamily N-acetyltransferase